MTATPALPSDESANNDWTAAKVNVIYDHLAVWGETPGFYDRYVIANTAGGSSWVDAGPLSTQIGDGFGVGNDRNSWAVGLRSDPANSNYIVDSGSHGLWIVGADVSVSLVTKDFRQAAVCPHFAVSKNGTRIQEWWQPVDGQVTSDMPWGYTMVNLTGGDTIGFELQFRLTTANEEWCNVQMFGCWMAGTPA